MISKYIRKSRIYTLRSRKKSNHRKHTIKNYVLSELKRDRLRNRGLRKYSLSKLFSAVSYLSRNKYVSTNDKIYSTVVQETQAEMALTKVAETIFQENLNQEQNNPEEEVRASFQDRSTSTKDNVVPF